MIFNNNSDPRDSKPDFFDGEDIPETKKEKRKHYRTDDPRYWEEDESHGEWDHLRPLLRWKLWISIIAAAILLLVISTIYLRYFRPYATGGIQYGYIENIQEQGIFFKTYEGTLLPYRNLMDTTRPYGHDFVFTAANDRVAAALLKASAACKPVKVEYTRYTATLPWRGDSRLIVTTVSSIDPALILPPDKQPSNY